MFHCFGHPHAWHAHLHDLFLMMMMVAVLVAAVAVVPWGHIPVASLQQQCFGFCAARPCPQNLALQLSEASGHPNALRWVQLVPLVLQERELALPEVVRVFLRRHLQLYPKQPPKVLPASLQKEAATNKLRSMQT